MIFYTQHSQLSAIMDSKVPDILKQREMARWETIASEAGIQLTGSSPGKVSANIINSTPAQLFAYLQSAGIQCVDILPEDFPMWSRGIDAFTFVSQFKGKPQNIAEAESRDNLRASLRGIPIDQVTDTVRRLLWQMQTSGPAVNKTEEQMVEDMRAAGYEVPDGYRERPAEKTVDMSDWSPAPEKKVDWMNFPDSEM
jgi:hypothetical protein